MPHSTLPFPNIYRNYYYILSSALKSIRNRIASVFWMCSFTIVSRKSKRLRCQMSGNFAEIHSTFGTTRYYWMCIDVGKPIPIRFSSYFSSLCSIYHHSGVFGWGFHRIFVENRFEKKPFLIRREKNYH